MPERISPVEVFVLAGGQSRRMGVDKASMLVEGTPLICRVLAAVSHLGPTHIVGGEPSLLDLVKSTCEDLSNVTQVDDESVSPGPFGAIVGALRDLGAPVALVVACDLAVLTRADVDLLLAARRAGDADFAVPMVGGFRQWHGLCLAGRIVPQLRAGYSAGVRSLRDGFAGYSECVVVSPNEHFFADVDSPEDLLSLSSRKRVEASLTATIRP